MGLGDVLHPPRRWEMSKRPPSSSTGGTLMRTSSSSSSRARMSRPASTQACGFRPRRSGAASPFAWGTCRNSARSNSLGGGPLWQVLRWHGARSRGSRIGRRAPDRQRRRVDRVRQGRHDPDGVRQILRRGERVYVDLVLTGRPTAMSIGQRLRRTARAGAGYLVRAGRQSLGPPRPGGQRRVIAGVLALGLTPRPGAGSIMAHPEAVGVRSRG